MAPATSLPSALFVEALRLHQAGRLSHAEKLYRQLLSIDSNHPDGLHLLGVIAYQSGRHESAIELIGRAIALKGNNPLYYSNRGNALQERGRLSEAVTDYERALVLNPNFPEAHNNLGNTLRSLGRLEEAMASYESALALNPDFPEAHNNRGNALHDQDRLVEAIADYECALALKPDYAEACNNLGNALKSQGKLDQAVERIERALALKPDYAEAHGNLLVCLHYLSQFSGLDILARAKRFSDACEKRSGETSFANSIDPDRRLRIGYVSGDLANHPVGYFLANILRRHAPEAVEVFCYYNRSFEDDMSGRLRQAANHWRRIVGYSDAQVVSAVRQDEIDILVDLSGHTAANRLLSFANRPAPVQATWLGYFGTTGLSSMDYLLADRHVVAEGEEAWFTETVLRLPDSYLCFTPPSLDCPIAEPPSMSNNTITFGNFNIQSKTSTDTISLWARILSAVPNSRLLLKTRAMNDHGVRQVLLDQFSEHGVEADRLIMEGHSPRRELLLAYNRVDLALDPMPYGGGTTTAEALWMGVPVVTLHGATWVGRVSESILTTVGLRELVAYTSDEYVNKAIQWATNPRRLAELRSRLRTQLETSPFCDAVRFTRHLEGSYRHMWRSWCANQTKKNRQV